MNKNKELTKIDQTRCCNFTNGGCSDMGNQCSA